MKRSRNLNQFSNNPAVESAGGVILFFEALTNAKVSKSLVGGGGQEDIV